jgi:hypothetical protein
MLVVVRRLGLGQVQQEAIHAIHLVLDELDVVLHHRFTFSVSCIIDSLSLYPASSIHGDLQPLHAALQLDLVVLKKMIS